MRASSLLSCPMGWSATILLICTFTTAFRFDLFPRDFQTLFRRSLPGALAVAPQGAVGYYQPPPGPVTYNYNHLPLPTWPVAATMGTATTPTTTRKASQGAVEGSVRTGDVPVNVPRKNVAIVTGTVTRPGAVMAATQTAMARRDAVIASTSLVFSVFLAAVLV
ncbi:hypothetical protein P170DRAFT_460633 [Aspergillus steynii IBT 23096]|uniref:Uncharacterized protein n=1 Tax=Aspergillus steynii IBT 23096 TaxID=1392250 RepID=A0A2I2GNS0_9EURO|nr:uncharacterized protein P170DRAFT_460633 [Aspergillus steynii IBT 23096]PLB54513.1 hypothetical protein P170DRAFT_460633 [Aspergillus steynii IBT 23096]